jgi:hypothetical protein
VIREGDVAISNEVRLDDLKALFHVKTWGREDCHRGTPPPGFRGDTGIPEQDGPYVKTVLEFFDGEKIFCYSRDYDPQRRGFYAVPADPEDNNTKIYVVTSSLVNIQILRE